MNKHKDHIASCLCCKYLYGNLGATPYSDVTPGWGARIDCEKDHFGYESDDCWQEALADLHDRGRTCRDYEPKD